MSAAMAEMSARGTMTSATVLSRSFRMLASRILWSSLIGVSLSGVSSISSSIASRTASFFSRRRRRRRMARSRPPVDGASGLGAGPAAAEGSGAEAWPLAPGGVLCAVESGMAVKIGYRPRVAIVDVRHAFLQTSFGWGNARAWPRHLAYGRKRTKARPGARRGQVRRRTRLSDDRHGGNVWRRPRREDRRRGDRGPQPPALYREQGLPAQRHALRHHRCLRAQ